MQRAPVAPLDEPRVAALLAELGDEARKHRFDVAPNPCVGAAVVAGDRVVARGFHERWGGPHAEANAFDAALAAGVPQEQWDALVVTLEPCSSTGKTGPCVERVLASGVKRVVVGALDPDPRHSGTGLRALEAAGVEVVLLEGAAPLVRVAPHFLRWVDHERVRRPRPWVIAKWAQTRSGHLTPPESVGEGRWISGPQSRAEVHVLRGRVEALLTGVGTVLEDDPRLTVRAPGDPSRPPLRVVLDGYLRTRPDAALFAPAEPGEGAGPVRLLTLGAPEAWRASALVAAGAEVVSMPPDPEAEGVSLRDVHAWLWEQGAHRVLLEAGPRLLTRHLELGLVDQVAVYTGPVNGGRGPSMAAWFHSLRLDERRDRESGDDSVLESFVLGAWR